MAIDKKSYSKTNDAGIKIHNVTLKDFAPATRKKAIYLFVSNLKRKRLLQMQ